MPALKSLPDRFSLQGCEASEGVTVPVKRKRPRCGDAFGTELFSRRRDAGSSASETGTRRKVSRLSMAQNNSSEFDSPPVRVRKVFGLYRKAALAKTPGLRNSSPASVNSTPQKRGKRQPCQRFTQSSRNNFKNKLATVRNDAVLYTMCLSLPGYVEHFTHPLVKLAFIRFMKRLATKTAQDPAFHGVAGFYKQELQKRKELHFHLVFAGITLENLDLVHHWVVDQWVFCVMDIPGIPPELVAEETRKMRDVHLFKGTERKRFRDSNFQLIEGNFHAYFSKYLGKDDEAHLSDSPIPGRWWGSFNRAHIPYGEYKEIELPERVAVYSHRVARRIRQVRADGAKYRAICRKFGRMDGKNPTVSRLELGQAIQRWESSIVHVRTEADIPAFFAAVRDGRCDSPALGFLLDLHAAKVSFRSVVSGFRFPRAMKYSSVTLTGRHVPEMMVRVLQYSGNLAMLHRDSSPF